MDDLWVLAIAGSLRRASHNRALIRAAERLAPAGMVFETAEIGAIPPFDQDVEDEGDPPEVTAFKERIATADALLIATPEYQYSIPGVLKNALDWASRPPGEAVLAGKPVAIMGASTGAFGTVRAQQALRVVLTYNACPTVATPEVLVTRAADKVDANGEFTDDTTLGFVADLLEALADLTRNHLRVPT